MLTKSNVRDMVAGFRQANDEYKLRMRDKSSIYQAIINDFKSRQTKSTVSKNRRDRQGVTRPSTVAPLSFGQTDGRRVTILWPCTMVELNSSFISAVGYNAQYRVLKITMGKYTYAYQDVPESLYAGFLTTNSPGTLYNKVRKEYTSIALV